MVEHGAELMKPKRTDGLTPLHFAASNNDVHLLDFIVEHESFTEANVCNEEGWTPAHMAGFLNNFDALNLLLEHGADLSRPNRSGLSGFDEIVRSDNAELF